MSTSSPKRSQTQLIYALASIGALILMLIWMQGGFTSKTPPGTAQAAAGGEPIREATATVVLKEIDEMVSWPGTVTARTVSQIAPKVAARIIEITARSGDRVKAGQVLVKLDQRELQSRLAQTRSALTAAEAHAARTTAEARRTQNLFDKEAATQQSLEAAQAAARMASARVAEARSAIAEAESLFAESILRAPFDGVVVRRLLEPGDMALSGSPILVLQSAQNLRLETAIPANCARRIQKGETLETRIADHRYDAVVEEIAPAEDPNTRTILIKAVLNPQTGTQPGAFAWVDQPCGKRDVLLIPETAVIRTGQLESVHMVEANQVRLRHVRTGKSHNGSVEILSGLKEGDRVLVGGGK